MIGKEKQICLRIDPLSPFDSKIIKKDGNISFKKCFKFEIIRICNMETIKIVPVIVGALETVCNDTDKCLKRLEENVL